MGTLFTFAMPARVGYARTVVDDPDCVEQLDELTRADCHRVFEDLAPAEADFTPEWKACVDSLVRGDTLVVSRLECLAFTLDQLAEAFRELDARGARLSVCRGELPAAIAMTDLGDLVHRRAVFERGGRRELINAGLAAARSKGRVGGRRYKLSTEQVSELKTLMKNPGADPVAIGRQFGISKASVYNYLKV